MRKLLPCLLLLFSFLGALAQQNPLPVGTPVYNSQLEKELLTDSAKYTADKLALLMAITPEAGQEHIKLANQKLQALYAEIDAKKALSKPLPKGLKVVFDAAHRHFLNKYEDMATFYQTITSGTYNCVSATALYALILEHYNIAYEIKELPTHVYLVADPAGFKITVETTDPRAGYFAPDARFKKNFVDYMVKSKLISQQEANTQSTDELFVKYYQNDKTIDFVQLASLQYSNAGIQSFAVDQDFKLARNHFIKAYRLNPNPQFKYMLYVSTHNSLVNATYEQPEEVKLLVDHYNFQPEQINSDNFVDEFRKITQKFLINKYDTTHYRTVYRVYEDNLADTAMLNQIAFIYYMQSGRAAYLQNRRQDSFKLLLQAYRYNPKNVELQGLLTHSIFEQLRTDFDTPRIFNSIKTYINTYPFLKENDFMKEVLLAAYLKATFEQYSRNNLKEGQRYLSVFEQEYAASKVKLQDQYIVEAYTAAWGAYMRQRNTEQARKMARRGLAILPHSKDMKDILSWSK